MARDTPIGAHLPGFSLADPDVSQHTTIADMFAHRSSLPDHAGDLLEDLGYDRGDLIDQLKEEPLNPFRAICYDTHDGPTIGGRRPPGPPAPSGRRCPSRTSTVRSA